jgi:hypothetical protein
MFSGGAMRPVDQTTFSMPGGNCFSACVASILELPLSEVPYFMGWTKAEGSLWFARFVEWLRPRGLYPMCFNGCAWVPDGFHILSGRSPRGDFDHSVVAFGGVVPLDPSRGTR